MLVMYDAIEPSLIPAGAQAVAGYVGGNWPTYNEIVRRFPNAHHLSIAISASEDADCLDVEPGNAHPTDVLGWVERQKAKGKKLIVVYASLDEWKQISVPQGVKRWCAHYTYSPHIEKGFDATQWTDKALGRNLDESLCSIDFFSTVPPGPPIMPKDWMPVDEARWEKEWRELKGVRTRAAHERRVALKRAMTQRRKAIYRVATSQRNGWTFLNRYHRYMILKAYTK